MSTPTPREQPPERLIRELRHTSRQLVRALGLMQDGQPEGIDCSPAQCHALLEVSAHGRLTTGELAELLEVDKSTASRTLRPLQKAGLIEAETDPEDQRVKSLRLSETGRRRVNSIHAAADAQVRTSLELLNEEEREAVLRGVSLYEQALHRAKALAGIVLRPIEARDDARIALMIREVMSEFGAVGCGYSSEDDELGAMHRAYSSARSAYFVAEREGEIIAGGGIAPLEGSDRNDICELRKMHARPSARGLGIGRRLLELCLSTARENRFRTCYLETLRHMLRARALYEKAGFRAVEAPLGNTGHFACDHWYLLDL